MKLQTSNAWFYTAVVLFLVALVTFLLFIFGNSIFIRKGSFYIGLICFVLSIVSVAFSGIRKNEMIFHRNGIIMTGTVVIKGAPDKSGTDLYQLHEGSKITVLSTLGDWYEIKLGNGNVGWVEIKYVERI